MRQKTVIIRQGGQLFCGTSLRWCQFPVIDLRYHDEVIPIGLDLGHTATILDQSWLVRCPQAVAAEINTIGIGSAAIELASLIKDFKFKIDDMEILLHDIEIMHRDIHGGDPAILTGLLAADILKDTRWFLDIQAGFFHITNI